MSRAMKPSVLFVCRHNTGRSQMAEAYLRHFLGDRVDRADRIITMGCDVEGVPRVDDDWDLPDPKGQRPERVREIREMVKQKAFGKH
jgi:protein-tyrosine-phosphatase